MAKNMNDTSYRRLKVEELDAQAFHEDEENEAFTGPDERTIMQMVQNQRWVDILKELARSAPLKSKDQIVKDRACQVAGKALTSFKISDIGPNVTKLSPEEADILLHYVFRAFETAGDNSTCNTLLAFHDEIFKITGHGGLLRVLYSGHRLHPLDSA
ncbi:hypothetical protein FO519_005964 [Halicephalobus sp. NKZ332]|nr:hypothetical protein FO519_005964 [Halicephalobus sp. NKZ332]